MARVVKKAQERKREIVLASRELFLAQGYENTTMQDVISKVQIAKGTVYHYFSSKEELLEAVIEDMVAEYLSTVEKALKKSKGNALKKLGILVKAGRVAPEQIAGLHSAGNIGMHVQLLAVTISRLAHFYAKVISQGCEEGIFHVDNPLECAEIILAGVQFLTDEGCYPWSQDDLMRRARAIPGLIENLLNAPKDSLKFLFRK